MTTMTTTNQQTSGLQPLPGAPAPTQSMNEDALWELCLSGDTSMDGVFVAAVRTTGVYCRPSCTARKPKRENVSFFASWEAAWRRRK